MDRYGELPPASRLVRDGLRREVSPSWPQPLLLAHDGVAPSFEPVGTFHGALIVFSRATVLDDKGFIELTDGSLFVEPVWHPDNVFPSAAYRRRRLVPPRRQQGPWFSCLLFFAHGYFHWLCDVLPRFHRVLELLPAGTRFLVPWAMEPWQWDALAAVGVDRARCVQFSPGRGWVFDELYYAPPAAMTGDHDPEAIAWVRQAVLAAVGVDPAPTAGEKLYVTRRLAGRRRITNEAELWGGLEAAGFRMVEAERLSFADQVRLFARARVVVGPHGGGLTNIAWCRPGTRVAEIFSPASAGSRCFWTLSAALGHDYAALIGQDAKGLLSRSDIDCPPYFADRILRWAFRDESTTARPLPAAALS
ncbi:MAG: glycosyltransferase family 61 protein [Vicinamibacterales bacterium]|jgi:hypothetical protein